MRSRVGTWATKPTTTSPRCTERWSTTAGSTAWARPWSPVGTGSTTCLSPRHACGGPSSRRMRLESFNKQSRLELFRKLSGEPLDLLIIGGGITGASIFRDAALRGMRAALVEADDFASGTSGRSSKLVHGGLRYLKSLGFRLAWESCHERNLHVRLNKRLVRPMPFLVPLYRGQGESRALMRLGMVLYEGLSGFRNYQLHRFMSREETLSLAPALPVDGLTGGCLYYDAVVSDNRWTVETVKDGVRHGGVAVNHAPLIGLLREDGKIIGGRVHDKIGGEHYEVRARAIVNATGVFADQIRRMDDPESAQLVRLSKGTHLVFAEEDVPLSVTVVFSSPLDGRSLFLAKHEGCFLYGTSDDWEEADPGAHTLCKRHRVSAVDPRSFHARSGVGWPKGAVRLQRLSPASMSRERRSRLRCRESRRSYRGLSVGPDQRNRRQVDDGADHSDSGLGSRHREDRRLDHLVEMPHAQTLHRWNERSGGRRTGILGQAIPEAGMVLPDPLPTIRARRAHDLQRSDGHPQRARS